MTKAVLILPNGREISSGDPQEPGISDFRYTHRVNDGEVLDLGCACAAEIQVTVLHDGPLSVAPGMAIRCCYQGQSRVLLGQFLVDTVETGSNCTRITAYDRMTLLDVDLTQYLTELTGWPYTIKQLLSMVCSQCGVECAPDMELINGDQQVPRFLGEVTGRQLIRWIAGANGAFATMTPEGKLTFRSYRQENLDLPVASATLSTPITPIARVVIRQTGDDVGISYPGEGEAYTITGNPMLVSDRETAAANLLGRLQGFSYSPGKVRFFDPEGLCRPGMLLQVNGSAVAVFSVVQSGGISTIQCTGPASSQSAAAINKTQPLTAVQGKLMELKADLAGISAQSGETRLDLENLTNRTAKLELDAQGIGLQVAQNTEALQDKADANALSLMKSDISRISMTAQDIELSVESLRETVEQKADVNALSLMSSDISRISMTAQDIELSVQSLNETIEQKADEEQLQTLSDSMSTLKLTADGIQAAVSKTDKALLDKSDASQLEEVSGQVSSLTLDAQSLALSLSAIPGALDGKADRDTVTAMTEHFLMDADGLTISNTASGMGIRVNEEQVQFMGGTNPTTVIRPSDMQTTDLKVLTRLDLGAFSWIPRSNQNLSLRWTGGNQ